MREPNGIGFAGDWHMNTYWATNMIEQTKYDHNIDTIVHVGDYGFTFSSNFVKTVELACKVTGTMIYFVDGNHDDHPMLFSLKRDEDGFGILSDHVRYIPRGHRWEWWGLKFMGLGGASSVDKDWRTPWVDYWPTEKLTRDDVEFAISGGKCDIMICHDVPSGFTVPGVTRENGLRYFPAHLLDEAEEHRMLMRQVEDEVKPELFIHGHYHVAYKHQSWNDGCLYIGLDLDGHNPTQPTKNMWWVKDKYELPLV